MGFAKAVPQGLLVVEQTRDYGNLFNGLYRCFRGRDWLHGGSLRLEGNNPKQRASHPTFPFWTNAVKDKSRSLLSIASFGLGSNDDRGGIEIGEYTLKSKKTLRIRRLHQFLFQSDQRSTRVQPRYKDIRLIEMRRFSLKVINIKTKDHGTSPPICRI